MEMTFKITATAVNKYADSEIEFVMSGIRQEISPLLEELHCSWNDIRCRLDIMLADTLKLDDHDKGWCGVMYVTPGTCHDILKSYTDLTDGSFRGIIASLNGPSVLPDKYPSKAIKLMIGVSGSGTSAHIAIGNVDFIASTFLKR